MVSPAAVGQLAEIVVPFLALLPIAACGAEGGPGNLERLLLRPAAGAPSLPGPVVAERFDLLGEPERWAASATRSALGEPPGGGPRMWRLAGDDPAGTLALRRAGSYAPQRFNEIRVQVYSMGPGRVQVAFLRQGERVLVSAPATLAIGPPLRDVILPLPESLLRDVPTCDALSVEFLRAKGPLWVRQVELLRRPPESRLPDAAGAAELIEVEGEARRGWGLISGRPLVARVDVPKGARLSFACALPPLLAGVGEPPAVAVEARSDAGDGVAETFSVAERWQSAEIPLGSLAGRAATVRFELRAEPGGPAACALAEVFLWVPGTRAPDVLLVTSDTHRADHLGAAGGPLDVRTPALDTLAGQGVLFEDCFSPTNVTNPAHMALLTGAHPRAVGVVGNAQPLRPDAPTLALRFAAAGYRTQAAVSVRHLGAPESGLGIGFDRMAWPIGNERRADETVALVERWLAEPSTGPRLLWLHLFDAHGPYQPPREFAAQYYPSDKDPFDPALPAPDLPAGALGPEWEGLRDLAWPPAAYKGEVAFLDAQLARLLSHAALRTAIVAVTSDHGESLGAHGIHYSHAGLYPDSLHVPLLLSWPGGPRGERVRAPVSLLDLGATLLDLVGLERASFPGRSLRALLGGGRADESPRFALDGQHLAAAVTFRGLHLILQLREQQHHHMSRGFEKHQVQLFDRTVDPGCEHDLVDQRKDDAARLRRMLVGWLAAGDSLGWSGETSQDPEVLGRLSALGYVQASAGAVASWEADDCDWCRRFGDA